MKKEKQTPPRNPDPEPFLTGGACSVWPRCSLRRIPLLILVFSCSMFFMRCSDQEADGKEDITVQVTDARKVMEAQREKAKAANAGSFAAQTFERAQTIAVRGDQAFFDGNFPAAKLSYDSATAIFKQAFAEASQGNVEEIPQQAKVKTLTEAPVRKTDKVNVEKEVLDVMQQML